MAKSNDDIASMVYYSCQFKQVAESIKGQSIEIPSIALRKKNDVAMWLLDHHMKASGIVGQRQQLPEFREADPQVQRTLLLEQRGRVDYTFRKYAASYKLSKMDTLWKLSHSLILEDPVELESLATSLAEYQSAVEEGGYVRRRREGKAALREMDQLVKMAQSMTATSVSAATCDASIAPESTGETSI